MGDYQFMPSDAACIMASYPVVFPDGKVIGCVGPPIVMPAYNPLYLGNLHNETIKDIFDRSQHNYILHAIRVFGPHRLVKLLAANGYGHLLPDRYIENATCDVCYRLFSSKEICTVLNRLSEDDQEFRLQIQYGRYYYLSEDDMIPENFREQWKMAKSQS